MQHLFWNKLVVFLLLPLSYITCMRDKDRGSFCGVILKGKAQDEFLEMLVPTRSLHLVNYALNFKEKPNKTPDTRILSVRLKKEHIYGRVHTTYCLKNNKPTESSYLSCR